MKPMPILYLAGPYNAGGNHRENITNASRVALEAWRAGWATICPQKNTSWFHLADHPSERVYLVGYLAILARCDAVLMLPNWQISPGARAEREYAVSHGIPVHYYEDGGIPGPGGTWP